VEPVEAQPEESWLAEVVARNDLDELVRVIDAACERRDWDALVELCARCESAQDRGFQLWPVAHHASYRLALEAPAEWAALEVVDGAARFAPGPLPEVAAQHHAWDELEPSIIRGPAAALMLHECVMQGEDLTGTEMPGPDPLELPLVLQDWEPDYALAIYRAAGGQFPSPEPGPLETLAEGAPAKPFQDPESISALLHLVQGWTNGSTGQAVAVAVDGDARSAIAIIEPGEVRVGEISGADAMAWMAWAAASGGTHGRRRGAATGRLDAWHALAAIAGFEEWPVDPDALGEALGHRRWFRWEPVRGADGWALFLAVEDPGTNEAWAIAAHDPPPVDAPA
jgi:hypothetical protein